MTTRTALLAGRPAGIQWGVLLGLSVLLGALAAWAGLPAALMIGPMVAAILVTAAEGRIRMSPGPFIAAQGVIGCMIGRSIPLAILDELVRDWPIFVAGIVSVIAAASAIGYGLTRCNFLPGTTAIWGTSPGASTAMIVMSEAYGADARLVAVMQYLRVVTVIAVAALVARLMMPAGSADAASGGPAHPAAWFPAIHWGHLAASMGVALGGAWVATWLKVPAGALLLPMLGAMALSGLGWVAIELPPWLLALAYALVGWSVGLRFTRPILAHALRALPRIMVSVLTLIAVCGLIAGVLVVWAGIDPLTAYLATSPGGADSIAIIAATSHVDMRFVMAMQTARLVVVLMVSPVLSRLIVQRAGGIGGGGGPRT
jgi:membrane AbrB-like protein